MAAVGSLQPGMEALHVQGDYKDAPPPAKASVVAAAVESLQPAMESLHVQDFKDAAAAPAKGATAVGSLQPGAENLQAQDYKDASMYYGAYPAYAYGAYGGWGEYSTYLADGAQSPTAGTYADMYYGYAPYGVATLGSDGQIYGSQSYDYQYPSTYNKQQNSTAKLSTNGKSEKLAPAPQGDVSTVGVDEVKGLKNSNSTLKADKNTPSSNGSYGRSSARSGSYQNQTSWPHYPYYSSEMFSDKQQKFTSNRNSTALNAKTKGQSRNQNTRQYPHLMGLQTPTSPSVYSANGIYGYDGSYGAGLWYGSHMYSSGLYGGWNSLYDGKYRTRGRGNNGYYVYGNGNLDGFNELKRGPRSGMYKNQLGLGATTEVPAKEQDLSVDDGSHPAMKDQYNQADFAETYSDAKFFIIKSYSEDDVHKSVKYNVWASTPNGNKKLDAAYQEAKEKSSETPVFLLFSVNASGQFVGLAEMVGRVDFDKTVEHWQQDKWTGCFPVKWHIVKDVPNSLLKHIILENNENKPVTNSRDTHEVKFEQGLQVLKIFKDHVCKTSILDDFGFYDNREKLMQERKAKQQQSLKKVIDVKLPNSTDTEKSLKGETGSTELTEADVLNKELSLDKAGEKNGEKGNDVAPQDLKSPTEKLAGPNGC
ncbi:hypothetical protein BDA96_02G046900 [Sorghum bicolor]|uniref:YTH domain-containing family protein n=2 Tax=Sorghum bicolor TaxID=4558 RepID=A0A921URN3_SORBI|nr:uncharacterized protein LOC8060706 [Sorghum bicolor]KAG0541779.1 hypothetical protein BDA96_02G046900 [Sorghum bicolor]KXG34475.2 hypothetical protein SORBI_3002G047000 [Sorghum bicolor]|eukprot:XP_002461519.1 uncharacterized protein LOC8060706 [Sorghum bicolor]